MTLLICQNLREFSNCGPAQRSPVAVGTKLGLCTKDDSLSLTGKVNRSLFRVGVTDLPQETIEHAHRICSDDIAALGYSRLIPPAARNQARPVFGSDTEFALFHAIRERNQRILALWEELNNVASQENEAISPEGD